ncbi:hypothetical protein AYO47_03365 [Planctomyces sp. SCGC AG-212-M04]|nr:hypothetical protein AYO47_03365 [Planctomyces sp. SCGC AG-212-M04]
MSAKGESAPVVDGGVEVSVAGERLVLHPEKGVWWPGRRTVFIADTHFGKTATFRAHGVPIGDETLQHDLERLSELVAETSCERLVILGDLIHARRGRSLVTLDRITAWRRRHAELAIELVKGNHDRAAGPPLEEWAIKILPDRFEEDPFVYRHDPVAAAESFVLAGHLHPKVVLPMEAGGKAKLACFWIRAGLMVLPAFGSFIDSAAVEPAEGDAIYAIAERSVHDVTPLLAPRGR